MLIAYDTKLRQPGCPILQAALGCDADVSLFPSVTWLLAPTPDLGRYEIDDTELAALVGYANEMAK